MIGTLGLHANEVELSLTGTGRLSESVTGVANFGEITGAPVSEDVGQGQMVERLAQRQEASRHISGVWAPQVCRLHRPQPWFVTTNPSGDVEGKEPKAHVGNGVGGGKGGGRAGGGRGTSRGHRDPHLGAGEARERGPGSCPGRSLSGQRGSTDLGCGETRAPQDQVTVGQAWGGSSFQRRSFGVPGSPPTHNPEIRSCRAPCSVPNPPLP